MKRLRPGVFPCQKKKTEYRKKLPVYFCLLMAALMLAGCGKGEGISILPERGSSTNTARAASDPGESAEALSVADGFGSGVKSPAGSEEASAEPEDTEDERPSYDPENSREEKDWAGIEADKERESSVSSNSTKPDSQDQTKQENDTTKPENDSSKSGQTSNPDGSVNVDVSNHTQTRPDADTKTGTPMRLTAGSVAPNFTADLASGSTFKMSDYDNKIVVLNFWTDRESTCNTELEVLQKLQDDKIEDVEILCINAAQSKDVVDRFINEHIHTVRFAYDETGKISDYYPADGYPYTLIISKGVVKKTFVGVDDSLQKYRDYTSAIQDCKNAGSN